jgi:septal ring factor EnvC (AmiA/AmiB activator)
MNSFWKAVGHDGAVQNTVENNQAAGVASQEFNQQMAAEMAQMREQQKRMAALQAMQQELGSDAALLDRELHGIRQKIELTSKKLSDTQVRKERLQAELHKTMEEIDGHLAAKAELTQELHKATAAGAEKRERKLKAAGYGSASGGGGGSAAAPQPAGATAAAAPPVAGVDLLGLAIDDTPKASRGGGAVPPLPGMDLMGGAGGDLMGGDLMGGDLMGACGGSLMGAAAMPILPYLVIMVWYHTPIFGHYGMV